jgi:hypothetical protein
MIIYNMEKTKKVLEELGKIQSTIVKEDLIDILDKFAEEWYFDREHRDAYAWKQHDGWIVTPSKLEATPKNVKLVCKGVII